MSSSTVAPEKSNKRKKTDDGEEKEDHYNPDTTTTLFVSNLPYSATTVDLTTHFSDVGPVRSAFVVLDKETKKSKGVGYVSYAMREDAETAVKEMNGGSFGDGKGRRLGVEWAGKRPAAIDPESTEPAPPKIKKPRPALPSQTHITEDSNDASTSSTPAGPSDPKAIRTLIVSNLPPGLTKAIWWKKVRKTADVEEVIFPAKEDDLTVGHIVFPTAALATAAVAKFHAHTYKDHLLSCVVKKRFDKLEAAGKDGGGVSKGSRLIVRNLPWDTTTQTLQTLFLPHGPIHSITLPPPIPANPSVEGSKPRARGFAFVWMLGRKDAENALEAVNGVNVIGENGKEEGGRTVAVDWALSKDKWKEAEAKVAVVEETKEDEEVEEEAGEEKDGPDVVEENEDGEMIEPVEDEEEEVVAEPVKPVLPPPEEGTTLFIRNLSFEATEDQLRTLFRSYGPLRYARITLDKATGRSRGTGFVCFWKKEDAERAVEQARLMNVETGSGANSVPVRNKAVNPFAAPSILTVDPSSSLAANLVMHGRVLDVEFAVTREEAAKLKDESDRRKEKVDKRNTYLMREGVIFAGTPAAATLAPLELEKRTDSFNSRKTLLSSNPSLYISKTRLSIRQLPLFCTERTLKRLAIHASREFEAEVTRGEREGLDEEEARDGTLSPAVAKAEESGKSKKGRKERMTVVIQAKVVRATEKVDPLTGIGKSKGYGFLEMRSHQDALRVLRWANNNPTVEGLMRDWWTVELTELIERTRASVDEGRLEEIKRAGGLGEGAVVEEEKIEVLSKKAKAKAKAKAEAEEDGEEGPKKKEKVELSELESRLKRLTDKEKELKELIEAGREVVMKKTLIVEFSIENVQVVQRRVAKVSTPFVKRTRDGDDGPHGSEPKKRRPFPGGKNAPEPAPAPPQTDEDRKKSAEAAERKNLGLLIGKKRRERREKH